MIGHFAKTVIEGCYAKIATLRYFGKFIKKNPWKSPFMVNLVVTNRKLLHTSDRVKNINSSVMWFPLAGSRLLACMDHVINPRNDTPKPVRSVLNTLHFILLIPPHNLTKNLVIMVKKSHKIWDFMEHHHNTTLVSYLYTSPNGMTHKNTHEHVLWKASGCCAITVNTKSKCKHQLYCTLRFKYCSLRMVFIENGFHGF